MLSRKKSVQNRSGKRLAKSEVRAEFLEQVGQWLDERVKRGTISLAQKENIRNVVAEMPHASSDYRKAKDTGARTEPTPSASNTQAKPDEPSAAPEAATTAVDPLANLPNGGQSIPQASMHNIPRDQANMSNFVTACQVDMLRTTTLLAAYPESQAKVDAVVQGDNEMAGKLYGIVLATGIDPCPELSALSGAPPGIEPPSGNASQ